MHKSLSLALRKAPGKRSVLGAVTLAFGIGRIEVARDILQKAYNRSDEVMPKAGKERDSRSNA